LPKGVSANLCAEWITKLRRAGKKVLFDSSRDALKKGITAKPWLIKPNDEELAELLQKELTNSEQCQSGAIELADTGIDNIVISMGAEGVLWLNNKQWIQSTPPRMTVVSTVGAGDTLVSGLCWGHMQAMEKTELLRFATALSALAVSQVGVGVPSLEKLKSLQEQVEVIHKN
jgi:1-phosphofructokinase